MAPKSRAIKICAMCISEEKLKLSGWNVLHGLCLQRCNDAAEEMLSRHLKQISNYTDETKENSHSITAEIGRKLAQEF